MAIGQNTTWIIVHVSPKGVPRAAAECWPDDKRRALRFNSAEAAFKYVENNLPATALGVYFPIAVPA